MKLKNRAFPYPVIRPDDGISPDYVESTYSGTIELSSAAAHSESNPDLNQGTLKCTHLCSNEDILKLIQEDKAKYAALVISNETFYRKLFMSKDKEQSASFRLDDLYGRVEIEPYIVVTESVEEFSSADLDAEYGDATFSLQPGDILAVGKTTIETVEFEKTSIEALIRVRDGDERVQPEHYYIEPGDYYIYICMGKKFRKVFDWARSDSKYRPFLALSVYKDAVFHALWELANNEDGATQHWGRALQKRVDELGLTLGEDPTDISKLNEIAQAIFSAEGIEKLILGVSDESIDD